MKALILMIACLSIALNAGEPDGLVQQTPSAWESAQDSGKDAASQLREQDSADADAVIDAYNRVKYGLGNVTEQELQAARRYVKGR